MMWRARIQSVEASDSEDSETDPDKPPIGVESDSDDDANVNDNRGGGDASVSNINRGGEDLREEQEQDRTTYTEDELMLLKKDRLKELLKKLGLKVGGNKKALVCRLLNASDNNAMTEEERLSMKSNAELKGLLRDKGWSQQGNKSVLVNRLLGKEKSAKKKVEWKKSRARELLQRLMYDDKSYVHNKTASEVYLTHEWFQDYPLGKFQVYFKDMKAAMEKHKRQVAMDNEAIERELARFPRNQMTNRGYPFWDTHEASRLLRRDVEAGTDQTMKPEQLRLTEDKYQEFPLSVFRNHLYQERRRQKELKMKMVQRNKIGKKKHLAEIEKNKTDWERAASNVEVTAVYEELVKMKLG